MVIRYLDPWGRGWKVQVPRYGKSGNPAPLIVLDYTTPRVSQGYKAVLGSGIEVYSKMPLLRPIVYLHFWAL